jgi:uncharacterized membrane protein YhaH (DUF805 family)
MDFQQAIKSGFSNYANFTDRAARSEFWYWQLFVVVGGIAAEFLDLAVSYGVFGVGGWPLSTLFWLVTLVPNLAVMVRRLHDIDRNGWWLLLVLIPLIGSIVLIVWWCTKGTSGYNLFGSDPLPPDISLHSKGRSLHPEQTDRAAGGAPDRAPT